LVVGRRYSGWMIDVRQLLVTLLFRVLNSPLDVSDCFEIFDEFDAVALPQRALEVGGFFGDRIENASVLPNPDEARFGIRAAAIAKQPLEHCARVVLRRQRGVGAAP